MLSEYRAAIVAQHPLQPSVLAVKDEIQRVHTQTKEMERDLKKLEAEKKIIQFHK